MSDNVAEKIRIEILDKLTKKQKVAVNRLQEIVFPDVSDNEAEEDFNNPIVVQVLAFVGKELVGWAGVHCVNTDYEGRSIVLGGYGIGTHSDYRRKGIASKVSAAAMDYLRNNGCDVGFLSTDLKNIAAIKLHQKNGFVPFPRKYSWTDSSGEIKYGNDGMIAPIGSQDLFEYVLNGNEVLYVGNGYW